MNELSEVLYEIVLLMIPVYIKLLGELGFEQQCLSCEI
jgi:hypothetical protein